MRVPFSSFFVYLFVIVTELLLSAIVTLPAVAASLLEYVYPVTESAAGAFSTTVNDSPTGSFSNLHEADVLTFL